MSILSRDITIKARMGFPTQVYFSMIDYLKGKGYEVKKVTDWLEINPRSPYHEEMIRKKGNIEERVGRILPAISEMRRDIQLIKHDLRRLEEVQGHFKEGDEQVLKSDFVDLVDRGTGILSLIDLASSGKFPTIVVDFYQIKDEESINKLDVSKTEKGILKKKWRLYQYWKKRYGREINDKVDMLKNQLNSREASLNNYKESLKPYLKALHQIKTSEQGPPMLDDPLLVQGYYTSIAGVELSAWKGISPEEHFEYKDKKEYPFFCFFQIVIRRFGITQGEKETMQIKIDSYLKNGAEIEEEKKKIKKNEEKLLEEIEQFQGEKEISEQKKEEQEQNILQKISYSLFNSVEIGIRLLVGKPKEGKYYLPKGYKGTLEGKVKDETKGLYSFLKKQIGGMGL